MMMELLEKAAPIYRRLRRMKNRVLNQVDAPVIVLAYHRVTRLQTDPHQLAVTPENFRAHMEYLRQNYRVLRFEESWTGVCEPAVVVTFDDGYADNLYEALPILEEARVPVTFFISTGILESGDEFWSDDLERLLLGEREYPPIFTLRDPRYGGSWPSVSHLDRLALHERLHCGMLKSGPRRRQDWLDQLRRWAGAERKARALYRPLNRDEVRLLATRQLVTIGAHGVTHTPLAVLSSEEQRREIFQSKRELEELVDHEVSVFSYPFGGRSQYDRTTRGLCREAGFCRAVTTFPGQAHRWTDPLQMPRQLVRNWDAGTFAAQMESFRT